MERTSDRSDHWAEVLLEIEQRLAIWSRVDPGTLPVEELLNRFRQGLRDEMIIRRLQQQFIGELAEIQVREWLGSGPDLPDWFAIRSAESVTGNS